LGTPRGNDYPLASPLPGTRIKCNFSRNGLRVELLLHSTDRRMNLHRLEVLVRYLPDLQDLLDSNTIVYSEPLDGRTQARIATYRVGTIAEQRSWPMFLDWFQTTAIALDHALRAIPAIRAEWPV
jgi:hypothetical protein